MVHSDGEENEKGTNFCFFSVGLEPATPARKAVTQFIPPPWCAVVLSTETSVQNFLLKNMPAVPK